MEKGKVFSVQVKDVVLTLCMCVIYGCNHVCVSRNVCMHMVVADSYTSLLFAPLWCLLKQTQGCAWSQLRVNALFCMRLRKEWQTHHLSFTTQTLYSLEEPQSIRTKGNFSVKIMTPSITGVFKSLIGFHLWTQSPLKVYSFLVKFSLTKEVL